MQNILRQLYLRVQILLVSTSKRRSVENRMRTMIMCLDRMEKRVDALVERRTELLNMFLNVLAMLMYSRRRSICWVTTDLRVLVISSCWYVRIKYDILLNRWEQELFESWRERQRMWDTYWRHELRSTYSVRLQNQNVLHGQGTVAFAVTLSLFEVAPPILAAAANAMLSGRSVHVVRKSYV